MIYGTREFDELIRDVISKEKRHESYEECCEHAEEMSWHLYGVTPVELLERVRPNESTAVKDYRIENYEPITLSAADKAIDVVSKMFNPNLYSIRWKEKGEQADELKSYTLEYYPDFNSVVNFTKDVLLRKMLADPNGVAVVTPERTPDRQAERIYPIIKIYGSKAIVNYDYEHYLILTKKEEEVTYYFDYYDKDKTISFKAYIQRNELIVKVENEYEYNLGELPVWKLRGTPVAMDNGNVIFKSFFNAAVPFWNDAITHESDLKASFVGHLFPQKYELSEQCNYRFDYDGVAYPCKGGRIKYPKGLIDCPHCDGSGYEPIGPLGIYKYTKDKLIEGGPMGVDPVGYITVPIDATKLLSERVRDKLAGAMTAINMDVEEKVGEIQSGVAKTIDRSAQYDFLYNLGSVVFDIHLTNFYYFANKIMFSIETISAGREPKTEDKNLPEINKPTQFDIGSVTELVNNFKLAKESGLDPNYLQMKQIEIQSRDLTTNPDIKIFTTLLLELDPLPGMSSNDIKSNVSLGFNSKQDATIHFNLKAFTERAIRENSNFIKLPKDKQLEILKSYADEMITQNKPVVDMTLFPNVA